MLETSDIEWQLARYTSTILRGFTWCAIAAIYADGYVIARVWLHSIYVCRLIPGCVSCSTAERPKLKCSKCMEQHSSTFVVTWLSVRCLTYAEIQSYTGWNNYLRLMHAVLVKIGWTLGIESYMSTLYDKMLYVITSLKIMNSKTRKVRQNTCVYDMWNVVICIVWFIDWLNEWMNILSA